MRLPPYEHFPDIGGENISLRAIRDSDLDDLIEISFYDAQQATTLHEAIEMQSLINRDYNAGNSIHWGIVDNLTNKVMGTCGYYRGLDKGIGELGCVLLPRSRGKGFMTAAMKLVMDFGINEIGLERIRAITTQQNHKAIQLLNRLNFTGISKPTGNEIEYEYMPGSLKTTMQ